VGVSCDEDDIVAHCLIESRNVFASELAAAIIVLFFYVRGLACVFCACRRRHCDRRRAYIGSAGYTQGRDI